MIRGIHCSPQVDQSYDRKRARRNLKSEGERRLRFPRCRHLERMDNNDRQCQYGKAAGNVEGGIECPECSLSDSQSHAYREERGLPHQLTMSMHCPLKAL